MQHFAQSGSLVDSQPGALQEYGACLMELKQTEKAIPIFQRILASHPRGSACQARLGGGSTRCRTTPRCHRHFAAPAGGDNPDVSTMQLAAAAYEANKDTPNAVKILRDAIVKDPRNVGLYVDFANIAMTHQSFQTGIDMVNAGLKLQPKAAELYLARGVLYVQLADYEKAEADFEKAEQLDPRQSLSAAAQGMVAEEKNQNDPDQALATVRAKLAKKPGDRVSLVPAGRDSVAEGPGSGQRRIPASGAVGQEGRDPAAFSYRRAQCSGKALSAGRADCTCHQGVQAGFAGQSDGPDRFVSLGPCAP